MANTDCGWTLGYPETISARVRCRLWNGSVRCGTGCSGIVYSVRIGPLQATLLLFQLLPQTLQPSEFVVFVARLQITSVIREELFHQEGFYRVDEEVPASVWSIEVHEMGRAGNDDNLYLRRMHEICREIFAIFRTRPKISL
jgi:hypothetical protein